MLKLGKANVPCSRVKLKSFTSPTLASTDFWACSPWVRVSLVVGKSSWCQAAALPVGTRIRFVNSDVTSTRRSLRRCRAFVAAMFNCSDVNGGMSTSGGGGALITPETVVAAVIG
jgi:hypothetical protein